MKTSFKKYFSEGFLIVFSVLFALFINGVSEDLKIKRQKQIALDNIKTELIKNQNILKEWQVKHRKIDKHIAALVNGKNEKVLKAMKQKSFLDFGLLTNSGEFINKMLNQTAWETTKATTIITELDFLLVEKLTKTYELQKRIINNTINDITNLYYSSESHDLNNIDKTVLLFSLRFNQLTGQQSLLAEYYEDSLKLLE